MLFIPAHKTDWVHRVDRFGPDSVVLDLEDAVPHHLKVAARPQCREAIGVLKSKGIPAFVRINNWDEGGRDDVLAVAAAGFSGVMLPKARDVGQIRELDNILAYVEGREGLPLGSIAIMPLPETAEGLADARHLVAASRRCVTLAGIVGGVVEGDVARAMGFRPTVEGTEQLYLASKMVLDARAGGAAARATTPRKRGSSTRCIRTRATNAQSASAMAMQPAQIQRFRRFAFITRPPSGKPVVATESGRRSPPARPHP
jgi:citrate lyase subunit beta/citryl-CoA lyase